MRIVHKQVFSSVLTGKEQVYIDARDSDYLAVEHGIDIVGTALE